MRRLALAACGLFCAASASALDLPLRKTGLWEMSMTFEGRNAPPVVMQHCVDADTDKLMNANYGGMTQDSCTKQDVQTTSGAITVDSVCTFGSATTVSHAIFTGDFEQAYTIKVKTMMDTGRPDSMPEIQTTIEAKWVGACKAGQKPGDVMMPGRKKFNVLDPVKPAARR